MSRKFEIIFLLLAAIAGCALRISTNPDWSIEAYFWGDAINRFGITLFERDHGLTLKINSFWLPLFFIINAIPLFISRTVESILSFNLILNLISVFLFYDLVKRIFNKSIALCSFFILMFMPEYCRLAMAVMSENMYSFLIIAGLAGFYRYRESKNTLPYLLAMFCFGAAMLVRYEGLILFCCILFYTSIFEKKWKLNFLPGIIFFLMLGIYEYQRYLDTGIPMHGLATNGPEVQQTILVRNRLQELLPRFSEIRGFFHVLGGISLFLPLLGLIKFLRYKTPLNPYFFTFIVSFIPLLLGSLKGDILLLPRYWVLPIALSFPISLKLIFESTKTYEKIDFKKTSVFLVTALTFSLMVFRFDAWAPPEPSKIREMTKYLVNKNYYAEKKVFHDDLNFNWAYDAIYVYLKIDHNLEIDCCNFDSSLYLENGYVLNDKNLELFKELIEKDQPKVFALGSKSPMSQYLKQLNFKLSYGNLVKDKQFGDYQLYVVEENN